MRIHDGLLGLLFIVLGIAVVVQAIGFPGMPGQAIGPGTFPTLFGTLFIIGGLIIGWQGIRSGAMPLIKLNEGWAHKDRALAAAIAIFGTLILAIYFEQIGFIIGAAVLLLAMYWVQGFRKPIWIGVTLAFVASVYYGMAKLLLVPLPAGPLF